MDSYVSASCGNGLVVTGSEAGAVIWEEDGGCGGAGECDCASCCWDLPAAVALPVDGDVSRHMLKEKETV